MGEVVSHTLIGAAGVVLGGFLRFLMEWKKAASDEWREIVAGLRRRVDTLEEQAAKSHAEHVACLEKHARLEAQIELLKGRHA